MRRTLQALVILGLAANAHAGIVVAFTQSTYTAQPGDLVHFTGAITNTGSDEIFLNGDQAPPPGSDFNVNDFFFVTVPTSLASGESTGTIDLFDVQVGNPPYGFYSATYEIFGGATSDSGDFLAQAEFGINVVPEPGSAMLLGIGVALGAACKKRFRRR
jgi:hypothetical protein